MPGNRKKFTPQVDAKVLAAVRDLAEKEGRQIQSLVDEAPADLVDKHRKARPQPHVMAAYLASHKKYGSLYKKLAEGPAT